jgi:hypothetical protein
VLKSLSMQDRSEAKAEAKTLVKALKGRSPARSDFIGTNAAKYPVWLYKLIGGFMAVVFIAAAMPSLFRLFYAGKSYFFEGIASEPQAIIVGASTFLLAEFSIILSTVSARVFFEGKERWLFIIPIGLGLGVALVGNWVVAQPHDLFGWLETIAPPIAVLFIALIGERMLLDAIVTRHANERAYQSALTEYRLATSDPEKAPEWLPTYANVLRDKIISINSVKRGATERIVFMNALTTEQWVDIIRGELQAENWYPVEDILVERVQPKELVEPSYCVCGCGVATVSNSKYASGACKQRMYRKRG